MVNNMLKLGEGKKKSQEWGRCSTSHITLQYQHMVNQKLIFPNIILTPHTLLWSKPTPV